MITKSQLIEALAYAATAEQVDLSEMLIAVYHDQLKDSDPVALAEAVRLWVRNRRTGDDKEYRRLPAVSELRRNMQAVNPKVDPTLVHNMMVANRVKEARRLGKSQDEIDRMITELDQGVLCHKPTT